MPTPAPAPAKTGPFDHLFDHLTVGNQIGLLVPSNYLPPLAMIATITHATPTTVTAGVHRFRRADGSEIRKRERHLHPPASIHVITEYFLRQVARYERAERTIQAASKISDHRFTHLKKMPLEVLETIGQVLVFHAMGWIPERGER